MAAAPSRTEDGARGIRRPRWHPLEIAFWVAPIPAFFVLSDRRQFLSQVFIYGLFALSLDLILGYAGILSLGHAAFFGVGAYTAGLLARHGWAEPLSGLGAAALVAGAFGYAVSFLVVPRRRSDALDGDAGDRPADRRGGESGVVDHRRRRRAGGHAARHAVRQALVRPRRHARPSSTAWRSWRWCSCWRGGSFTRRSACRCAESARTRGACRPSARTCTGGCARSSRSSAAMAGVAGALLAQTTRLRRHRHARLPALRRAAHHPGVRRHRAPLRRAARRGGVHRGAGRAGRRSAPPTGSSGWAPCWSCWCCSRPAG